MVTLAEKAKYLKQVSLVGDALAAYEKARADGAATFMTRKESERAQAANAEPLSLRLPESVGCNLQIADQVTLVGVDGRPAAVLAVEDKWAGAPPEASTIYFGGKLTYL